MTQPCTTQLCDACRDLLEEVGDERFDMYRRKLLIRGWAGQYSPVERRYVAAHRSEARQNAAAAKAQRLQAAISNRQQTELTPEGGAQGVTPESALA